MRTALVGFLSTVLFSGLFGEEVTLSWTDNSDNEDGFVVERSVGEGEFAVLAQVGADVDEYTDETAVAGIDYSYRVCAFNVYGYSDYTNVALFYKNVAPTISSIENVALSENEISDPVAFSVGDFESAAVELSLSVASSNPGLIGAEGITIAGSDAGRTLTLQPKANASGSSTITVTVSDGEDSSSSQFFLSVGSFVFPSLQLAVDTIGSSPRVGEEFVVETFPSDISLVSSVRYWLGTELLETVSSFPYTAALSISESGSYTLRAEASLVGRNDSVSIEKSISVGERPSNDSFVANLLAVTTSESPLSDSASYDLATDRFALYDDSGKISGTADTHRYYYVRVTGDASIRVRLADLDAGFGGSVAGLMLRSALYGKSIQSSLLLSGDSRLLIRSRNSKGGPTTEQVALAESASEPWLRMDKLGSRLLYYTRATSSADWVLVHEASLGLGSQFFVGLALAGGGSTDGSAAIFEHVSLDGEILVAGEESSLPEVPTGLLISRSSK